eukprot:s1421_g4.t1
MGCGASAQAKYAQAPKEKEPGNRKAPKEAEQEPKTPAPANQTSPQRIWVRFLHDSGFCRSETIQAHPRLALCVYDDCMGGEYGCASHSDCNDGSTALHQVTV